MGGVAVLQRRQRRLNNQENKENRAFSKFKKSAKYGSKEHRRRISQGVLATLYGRPIFGKYRKPGPNYMRRTAGYSPKRKAAVVNYQSRYKSKRPRIFK